MLLSISGTLRHANKPGAEYSGSPDLSPAASVRWNYTSDLIACCIMEPTTELDQFVIGAK